MDVKIPFYNILNMLLTGIIFICGCVMLNPHLALVISFCELMSIRKIPEILIVIFVISITYEIGLIINRIGSVLVEPILKKTNLIAYNDNYILFNKKKSQYHIMNTLSREYALSRTGITLFLVLMIPSLWMKNWIALTACIVIITINYFSMKKYSAKIVQLMNESTPQTQKAE